jgi:alkylated DNA nucleotide flippase Atl1
MVLAPSPTIQAAGITSFLVIDGQQRLTTVLIALCALRDHAATYDPHAIERFNELYLINKYEAGLAHYRLLPTQSDREAFFACVEPDPSRRNDRIGYAYSFFRTQLTQLGPDNQPLDVGRLEAVLCRRLEFVAITADRNDNVHRIFESLNDRGVRLTQADLLRNYIFMLLPNGAERIYRDVWLPMQNSLTSPQLETLVFVDLVLRGQTTIKRPDIYRAQQARLHPFEGNEASVEAEVRELARRASFFHRIVLPHTEPDPSVRAALERLDRWGASTTYPLLLHLYDLWDRRECSVAGVLETLGYVESFLVRRMIAGVPSNNLNRIFSSLVPQLPAGLPIAEGVRSALSGERRYWPSDQRLKEAFRSQPFYFQGRQEQKMVIFRRLEESFQSAEPIDWGAAKLTIEHILPQTLTDEWRAALKAEGSDPDTVHVELLHTLGNLTVTAYNGQLSNNPFDRKRQILHDSHLELNRAISPAGQWGRTEILARADELADRAIALWPGPIPGNDEVVGGRDWSRLHAALAALPLGKWTTYGDLAQLIGSHQVPVGQHVANTPGLFNAYRVLTADGRVADGFHWDDPSDLREVHSVLESEGIHFSPDRRADASQRLEADDLAEILMGEVVPPASPEDDHGHDWQWRRMLRYLNHFYDAPEGRLHEDIARGLAVQEGYDPRGVAGFYQGTASLRREGSFRVITDAGRQVYEENRYRLD